MKKIIAFLIVAIMTASLAACSLNTPAGTEKPSEKETGTPTAPVTESAEAFESGTEAASVDETAGDTADETTDESNISGVPNPIEEVGNPDEFDEIGITLDAPTGAENVKYSVIDDKIANVDFEYDGHAYTLRASKTEKDIAGLNGDTVSEKSLPGSATLTGIADGEKTLYKVEWSRNGTNYSLVNVDGASDLQVSTTYEDAR